MWRNFSQSARALVLAETGTIAWFAVRFDKATFASLTHSTMKPARTAHLNGAVAAALMANAAELLAVAPEIRQPTVLADKLPA